MTRMPTGRPPAHHRQQQQKQQQHLQEEAHATKCPSPGKVVRAAYDGRSGALFFPISSPRSPPPVGAKWAAPRRGLNFERSTVSSKMRSQSGEKVPWPAEGYYEITPAALLG